MRLSSVTWLFVNISFTRLIFINWPRKGFTVLPSAVVMYEVHVDLGTCTLLIVQYIVNVMRMTTSEELSTLPWYSARVQTSELLVPFPWYRQLSCWYHPPNAYS